jgi:Leucine-rich repeat (LRR) protein
METIAKNNFEKLRSIYKSSDSYLRNYFNNLKNEIEIIFSETEINDLNKIIQECEKDCLSKKETDEIQQTVNDIILCIEQTNEIDYIQSRFDQANNNIDYNEINELINLKIFQTEKYLFLNKTIRVMKNYSKENKTFLMLIKDEYLCLNDLNSIKSIYLKSRLSESNIDYFIEISLDFRNLKILYLSDNKITTIEEKTFENLHSLEVLWLSHNELTEINVESFIGLNGLKELNLFNNKIKSIQDKSFEYLLNLEILWLKKNNLKEINTFTFYGLKNLKEINLALNSINFIQDNCFYYITNLERLWIDRNQSEVFNHLNMSRKNLITIIND